MVNSKHILLFSVAIVASTVAQAAPISGIYTRDETFEVEARADPGESSAGKGKQWASGPSDSKPATTPERPGNQSWWRKTAPRPEPKPVSEPPASIMKSKDRVVSPLDRSINWGHVEFEPKANERKIPIEENPLPTSHFEAMQEQPRPPARPRTPSLTTSWNGIKEDEKLTAQALQVKARLRREKQAEKAEKDRLAKQQAEQTRLSASHAPNYLDANRGQSSRYGDDEDIDDYRSDRWSRSVELEDVD